MVHFRCGSSQHEMCARFITAMETLDLSIFHFKRLGPNACAHLVEDGEAVFTSWLSKMFFQACRRWQGQKRGVGKEVDNEARPLMRRNVSKGLGEPGVKGAGELPGGANSSLCSHWLQNADWCLRPLLFVCLILLSVWDTLFFFFWRRLSCKSREQHSTIGKG